MGFMAIERTDFNFPNQTAIYHGKVRDVYTINDTYMVAVASDRISAFDVILPKPIPYKGQVLNQTATYFLDTTKDIAPNWLISVPDPSVSIGYKCEPIKIEMVIRGLLVGHAWREYNAGKRELCGIALPEGLQEYDAFPEPIITLTATTISSPAAIHAKTKRGLRRHKSTPPRAINPRNPPREKVISIVKLSSSAQPR